jgi:hypothetical protein
MAGIIFLVLFFALGSALVFLVHYALAREDERWGPDSLATPPLEEPSEQTRHHDRAA